MSMYLEICSIPLSDVAFYVWDAREERVLFEGSREACESFVTEILGGF